MRILGARKAQRATHLTASPCNFDMHDNTDSLSEDRWDSRWWSVKIEKSRDLGREPSVSACKCYHALHILWVPGLWKMSASGNCPAAELQGLWLLDRSPSVGSLLGWGQPSSVEPLGREGFEREAHSSSLFHREDTKPRKGSRLLQGPTHPLQTNVCRLRRHQDVGIRQCHVCKGPCSPTSAGSDVHSLSPKAFSDTLVWEPSHQQGLERAQHRQATCTKLASWSTRCLAALELTFFFFFFGKLVLDLGTVKRNCRHIKKRLFVFCSFLDRASDVFIWRLGSHSLSHYLQLILCFLWATF